MDLFTKILWVISIILIIVSIIRRPQKTKAAMKKSQGMMKNMVGEIIAILFMIGLILAFIPTSSVEKVLGDSNVIISTISAAILGSVTLIPAFVAFPLVGSFVDIGASIVPAVAFLTTLTMVGLVTFPLEKQEFGLKFTLVRNSLSFVFAILIALSMGVIL
jgi:uncharacterized membrane protein YraQ (UPF0718 family)